MKKVNDDLKENIKKVVDTLAKNEIDGDMLITKAAKTVAQGLDKTVTVIVNGNKSYDPKQTGQRNANSIYQKFGRPSSGTP